MSIERRTWTGSLVGSLVALAIVLFLFASAPTLQAQAPAGDKAESGFAKPDDEPAPAAGDVATPAKASTAGKPPIVALEKPLTTDDEFKKWNANQRGEYNAKLQAGDLSDRDGREKVSKGIRQQLYAMTLPSQIQQQTMPEIKNRLLLDLRQAGNAQQAGPRRQYREFLAKEIIARCRELIDNQFNVRINAAILMGQLFVVEPQASTPGEFYTPVFDALMEYLQAPGQPEAVKIPVVIGLGNVATFGNPELLSSQRIRLANALIAELDNPKADAWYQSVLCNTLASINQVQNLDGQPFIVRALTNAMLDTRRSFCARTAAARAIGRAQLAPAVDLSVIAAGIADFSRQIVEARNSGKEKVSQSCMYNLYLAFHPKDPLEKTQHVGLLERVQLPEFAQHKKTVTDVYALVFPIIVHALSSDTAAFPPAVVTPVAEWLKANSSGEYRIFPGSPPITSQRITKSEPKP